ncbi:hypothetical protein LEMLEM_LOCUS1970, partial [Lemmus lemmus]
KKQLRQEEALHCQAESEHSEVECTLGGSNRLVFNLESLCKWKKQPPGSRYTQVILIPLASRDLKSMC